MHMKDVQNIFFPLKLIAGRYWFSEACNDLIIFNAQLSAEGSIYSFIFQYKTLKIHLNSILPTARTDQRNVSLFRYYF